MSTPLFFDPTITLEKRAYDTRIDDDVEEWPVAVTREAYKQLPFLKSYETEVELEKVDASRGYGVGKLLVWPARMEKAAAAQSRQLITVPVIIREREMAPMDVYTHQGRMCPMDQEKVASALFTPNMLERPAPRGQFMGSDLQGQLTPPDTGHDYGSSAMRKQSSVRNVLLGVAHSFRRSDIDALAEKLASDHGLRMGLAQASVLREGLQVLSEVGEKTAADVRGERRSGLKSTVVQVTSNPEGFSVKVANHNCYVPVFYSATLPQLQREMSKEACAQLLQEGRVTFSIGAVIDEKLTEKVASQADRVGRYRVYSGGAALEGVVIPKVVDFNGVDLGYQVFTGSGHHAFQEKIAGVLLQDEVLASDSPRGMGVFVYQEGQRGVAYEAVRIDHKVKVAEHTNFLATRMATGEQVRISLVPGLLKAASVRGEVHLPASVRFISLEGDHCSVSAVPAEAHIFEHTKTAGADSVQLISDGSCYSIRGANSDLAFAGAILEPEDAEFALGALGITGPQALSAMKTAAARGSVVIPRTRQVVPESLKLRESLENTAGTLPDVSDLRVDVLKELALLASPKAEALWKQASVVLSRETADTILSLGFVTPENASLYVGYLPELEKVSSKLAELLVASRLGMDDVRETAAKNAMTQVDAVVRGLESLRQRIS